MIHYIHQRGHIWQIFAVNKTIAVMIWKSKASYPDRTPVTGNPNKVTI